jgi:dihydrofolate synthase/folylpolyglutamate synthase
MNKIDEVFGKLFSLQKFGIKLGLSNIINFLQIIDNPHCNLKCFHIAGSNGKGSTASFISSILIEAGYKTGLYTSPHFVFFNERIKINGVEISDDYIVNFFLKHENYIFKNNLTFFEVTTALAFQYFFDNNVDYAIIETGLGGRLDATNVISPLASVITSVSLEHTAILGDTISKIASEKAGIIKKGSNVFVGLLPAEALNIIEEKCRIEECELFEIEEYSIKRENYLELYTEELDIDRLDSPLKGFYQKYNAALATLVVFKTLEIYNPHIIERGLRNVVKNSGLMGRYEILCDTPRVILDSAHNPESVRHFIDEFKRESRTYQSKILLFTALKDKAIEDMLMEVNTSFDEIYLTEIEFERASKIEDLLAIAEKLNIKVKSVKDFKLFIDQFLQNKTPKNCMVILGSMYLLGEVKKFLLNKNSF